MFVFWQYPCIIISEILIDKMLNVQINCYKCVCVCVLNISLIRCFQPLLVSIRE